MNQIKTPAYVLDESALEINLKLIQKVSQQAEIEIILAFKGFAMWSAFPLVRQYVTGATASSLHEAKLCNEHMQTQSHTYCVAYKESEVEELLALSSHISFNSLGQLEKFGTLARQKGVSVGIRINPEYSDVKTDLYNPASPVSRLGITSDELGDELLEGVEGLHFHVLCESDSYALEKVLDNLELKFGAQLKKIKWLNMGGGHLITREGYDVEHLIGILKAFKAKHGIDIIMEPGSAFAWQTGDLHTTVLDVVNRNGTKTAIIDASFTCHMPDCLEMPYRPTIEEGDKNENAYTHQYRLGGVSCLAGDFLEAYSFYKELSVGDPITFKDMIHYTMVKTSTFNGIQHPSIAIKRKDGALEVIREFEYEDYKNRLS